MKFYLKHPQFEAIQLYIKNIINLYYEESYLFEGVGDNQIDIQIDDQHKMIVTTTLTIDHKTYRETAEREATTKRAMKQALGETLITILTEHTGVIQSWGTLTGIRPTKLYHKYYQQGLSHEAISRILKHDYLIAQDKIDLMRDIVHTQLQAIPDLYQLKNEVSIYIGIPFCPTKCAYCTFPAYAIQIFKDQVPEFLVGLIHEIKQTAQWLKANEIKVTSIYFGGGTPTSISPDDLALLLKTVYHAFDMTHVREVTVEAGRPDTIDKNTLKVLNQFDIDRISINPQSFTDATLKAIGRHHTVLETIEKFNLSRACHMHNINMDLIIGLPNETRKEVKHSLIETERLNPESLTVHTLSFKTASEMTRNKAKYPVAPRDEIVKMMEMTRTFAREHDYVPYYLYRQKNILGNLENIGYSKPDKASLYNILIMEEVQSIIGLGCGASSKLINTQTGKIENFLNPKDPKSYNNSYESYTKRKIDKLTECFIHESKAE
ncbi:coproporphyrinogen III oxidase [Macrococcoides caseolyticum]|uniref:coproporphyrinogen III oxidase n=1 Tax=Macrococcoides caseolyticum TaxID=69966 RepID=UPI001EEEA135|nr:coproporphyrinogen III oxidase [Macrococcus caseolyticus]MCE4957662.1 coproporphyrinogen III oxidase [Macrococcus caseolyticus]